MSTGYGSTATVTPYQVGPTIDPEIRALIPPLRPDELEQLEKNILAEGVRDPLVIWNGILIDGHHRLSVCQKHGVPYRTIELELPDMAAAKAWVLENQLGRRNLTDDQRAGVAYLVKVQRSDIAKRERAQRANETRWHSNQGENRSLSADVSDKDELKNDTRAAVAKENKVSEWKVRQVSEIAKENPEVVNDIIAGQVSVSSALRELKREKIIANLESIEAKQVKKIEGVYDVIVIDPPWPIRKIERDCRPNQCETDYPPMTIDEIRALKIPAANDCHVWLWTTQKHLPIAFSILEAWDLKYICTFVWHKPGGFQSIGLPQFNAEFALYARKGTPSFIDTKSFPVCFEASRGEHSEKPELFYDMIRRVTAGRRLDMFSRRRIEGFDGWGKESE